MNRPAERIERIRHHALDVERSHTITAWKRVCDRIPVGLAHVDAHLFDRRPGGVGQRSQEVLQWLAFAGLDELQHSPAIGVRDDSVVDLVAQMRLLVDVARDRAPTFG